MHSRIPAAVLATVLGAAALQARAADPAPAAPTGQPAEATIPFANRGGIDDWHADGDNSLYVKSRAGQWYRAKLMGPCLDLRFANTIGFVTRPGDTFDRFSSIRVRGHDCALTSLVPSDPPPVKARRKKGGIAPVAPAAAAPAAEARPGR